MRSPPMASLSRKARLQQFSWQVLDDLALCSESYPRLAELAAQPLAQVDPALEALVPF